MEKKLPLLIIVNGLPGSGKTTIARRLAADLMLPAFLKDDFKEKLFETLGTKDREWSMELGRRAIAEMFAAAEETLQKGTSCLIESAFNPHFGQKDVEALLNVAPARIIQLLCAVPPEIRIERLLERVRDGSRHPGHNDPSTLTEKEYAELFNTEQDPMDLDAPLIMYRSDQDEPSYSTILEKITQQML